MKKQTRPAIYWFLLTLSGLLLMLLLSACDTQSTTTPSSGVTSTPTTSNVASTTPTTASTTSSATPTPTETITLIAYKGQGFTISYPKGWKVSEGKGFVTFSDPKSQAKFFIGQTANPNEAVSTEAAIHNNLEGSIGGLTNIQKVNVPQVTLVDGEGWEQLGVSGNDATTGQPVKIVTLADNHGGFSKTTKLFIISYQAAGQNFDQMNSAVFQPMLGSFSFL